MSLRLAVARQTGLDEAMAAKVDRHRGSDLNEKQKAALELADALMTMPGAIDDRLRFTLRAHFTHEELLELTLDVMKWSSQKIAVALGTDAEVKPGAVTDLSFDAQGQPLIGEMEQ